MQSNNEQQKPQQPHQSAQQKDNTSNDTNDEAELTLTEAKLKLQATPALPNGLTSSSPLSSDLINAGKTKYDGQLHVIV